VLTSDYATFVEMQEDLLLRIMDIVEASGTAIGFPTSVTLRAQDSGLDKEKAQAEAVKTWREAGDLPFPNYPPRANRGVPEPPSTTRRSTQRWRGVHPGQEGDKSDTVIAVVRRPNMAHRALTVVAILVLILGAGSPVYAAPRAAGMGGGGGMRGGGMGGSGQWNGGGGQWHGGGGQWHGGGNWHRGGGNWHGNFHGHGCCGTRVFVGIGGGFGWGPWWWGGWGYPYPYPYPYYAYAAPATTYVAQAPSYSAPSGTQQTISGVQREVVFPNGKYVLYGDGVNQPWQWVWVPSAPPPPPPPPQ